MRIDALVQRLKGGVGQQNLTAMRGVGDARCSVHHAADIIHPSGHRVRLAAGTSCMNPHPYTQAAKERRTVLGLDDGAGGLLHDRSWPRTLEQPPLRLETQSKRQGRVGRCDHEGVALSAHLIGSKVRDHLAYQPLIELERSLHRVRCSVPEHAGVLDVTKHDRKLTRRGCVDSPRHTPLGLPGRAPTRRRRELTVSIHDHPDRIGDGIRQYGVDAGLLHRTTADVYR